jgi:uncharacterized membrane protein YdbT with pleckstrin-like domain
MGFPKRLLIEGEEIALDLRPHWWFFAGPVAAGIPVVAVFIGVLQMDDGDLKTAAWWACAAITLAWAVWLAGRLGRWSTTHFVVTTERLIYRTGVFAKQGRDIPLDRVNDLATSQTVFERMLRSGDLLIESAGERGQSTFHNISHPDKVAQEIYRQIEANQERAQMGSGARAATTGTSVPEQIEQLAALRDRGMLTEAEFQAKKADLLSRM